MTREQLKGIIESAIQDEIESYEFYSSASEKIDDVAIKDIFANLAKEELGHRKFLEGFLESKATTIDLLPSEDLGIAETFDKPKLTTDMKFSDAIKLAVKNEEEAMDKYQLLADSCAGQEEKELFLGLRNMESMHKARLEEVFVNVGYVEAW